MTQSQLKLIEQINAEMQSAPTDRLLEDVGHYLLDYCAKNAQFAQKLLDTYNITLDYASGEIVDPAPTSPGKKSKKTTEPPKAKPEPKTLKNAIAAHKEACHHTAVDRVACVTLEDVLDFVWTYFALNAQREAVAQPAPREREFAASEVANAVAPPQVNSKRLEFDLDALLA
jgi:hypothetical protein